MLIFKASVVYCISKGEWSTKSECDYLNGWIKKRSHTQKSHPKVVNPRDIAGERRKKKKKKERWMDIFWSWILRSWLPWYVSYQHYDAFIIQQSFFSKNWKQFEWNTDLNGRERGWKETKNCSTWQNISYSLNNNPTHNMETRVKHNICPSLPFLLTCPLVSRQIINNKSIKLSFFSSSSSSSPAISLGFTILGEIFVYVTVF